MKPGSGVGLFYDSYAVIPKSEFRELGQSSSPGHAGLMRHFRHNSFAHLEFTNGSTYSSKTKPYKRSDITQNKNC